MATLIKIYGALVLIAFTIAFGMSANALVEQPGEFRAIRCGNTTASLAFTSNVTRVCLGQISALPDSSAQKAVQFELSDAAPLVFRVVDTSSDLRAFENGVTVTKLFLENVNGASALLKVTRSNSGEILNADGHLQSEPFAIESFENVFTIQ